MTKIYEPAEDSFLLCDFLKKTIKDTNISFLDMGCGSCIVADTAKEIEVSHIVCADINPKAVETAQQKGYKAMQSDLFQHIKGTFDIICFNAPYLPYDEREPKDSQIATTGGKKGDEIPVRFIKEAKEHLNKGDTIYLLISSLTPMNNLKQFNPETVATKKISHEELIILKIQ